MVQEISIIEIINKASPSRFISTVNNPEKIEELDW